MYRNKKPIKMNNYYPPPLYPLAARLSTYFLPEPLVFFCEYWWLTKEMFALVWLRCGSSSVVNLFYEFKIRWFAWQYRLAFHFSWHCSFSFIILQLKLFVQDTQTDVQNIPYSNKIRQVLIIQSKYPRLLINKRKRRWK